MRKGSPEFSMLLLIPGREEVGPKGPTLGGPCPCWVGEGAAWLQWPGHLSSPLPGCLHRVNLWGKCGPLGARAEQLPRTNKALCVLPVWSHPLQPTGFSFSPSSLAGRWLLAVPESSPALPQRPLLHSQLSFGNSPCTWKLWGNAF